jgi:UDP:flavonoid glycosyltransferase YjiC (YdhE family)
MPEKLTILFAPIDAVGHVNACIGVAEALKERGHRVVFAINHSWNGKLKKYGFEEELIINPDRDPNEDPAKYWANFLQHMGAMMALSPMEKMMLMMSKDVMTQGLIQAKREDPIYKEIVDRNQPDVIIIDGFICHPSLVYSGKPWVWSFSANPLFCIDDENLPPPALGEFLIEKKNISFIVVRAYNFHMTFSLFMQWNRNSIIYRII